MKFLKDNPFLLGIVVVTVLIVLGLGFWLTRSIALFAEEWDSYTAQVSKLHRLQNSSPYPSEENLQKKLESIKNFETVLLALEEKVRGLIRTAPEGVTPQSFQDELRAIVSELENKAKSAKVQLPEDFYLGMNPYKISIPNPESVPQLVRQMHTLKWITEKLIESGVAKIDTILREQFPSEKDGASTEKENEKVVNYSGAKIIFTGEAARVRKAVNEFLNCPDFLIIRAMSISNSSQQGPLKKASPETTSIEQSVQSLFGLESTSPTQKKEKLNILLGRESVTVQLHFDFVELSSLLPQ